MNREHAEHILDAYLSTCYAVDADGMYPETDSKKARDSLREVILDAMTEYRSKPTTTWPGITLPSTNYPRDWDYALEPQVICSDCTPKVTCTGIDPALGINPAAVVE